MYSNRFIAFAPLSVLLLSLSGCFGNTPPAQFYLLEPISEAESKPAAAGEKPLIALMPTRIPEYADRPQIVTASGKNAYRLSEFARWAEPLNYNIARVLQQDIAALVPAEVVLANASSRAKQAQFRVSVSILDFYVDAQNQARLTAQWHIVRGENTVASKQTAYRMSALSDDYSVRVEALNACLQRLSRDLAAALRQVVAQN